MATKELSGWFLSPDKFSAALAALATPACTTPHVKLYHNSPQQTCELLAALAAGNTSVTHLELYELHPGAAADALQLFLSDTSATCRPTILTISSWTGAGAGSRAAADALGQGLAAVTCSVSDLRLTGLSDSDLAGALGPLSTAAATRLSQLELVRCTPGSQSASACADVARGLTRLVLSECPTPDALLAEILQRAFLTPATGDGMPRCGLRSLHMCVSKVGRESARVVSQLLPVAPDLTELVLDSSAALGDAGAALIAAGLAAASAAGSQQSLTQLELCHCEVGPEGAVALAAALPPSLRMLAMDYNRVGAAGLAALLQALARPAPDTSRRGEATAATLVVEPAPAHRCALESLSLEGNWVRGAELPALPDGLTVRAPLATLRLGRNHLSDAGALVLQRALADCAMLTALDVSGNGIGPEGAKSLVLLLQQHAALRDLRLNDNRLHDSGMAALLATADAHPTLRVLRADGCRLTDPTLKSQLSQSVAALAARGARADRASSGGLDSDNTPLPPPKVGTRFPPEVYQIRSAAAAQSNGADAMMGGAPSSDVPGSAARMDCDPPLPPVTARRRHGSRFPPEVYARHVLARQESSDGADPFLARSGSVGSHDDGGAAARPSPSSHMPYNPFRDAGMGGEGLPTVRVKALGNARGSVSIGHAISSPLCMSSPESLQRDHSGASLPPAGAGASHPQHVQHSANAQAGNAGGDRRFHSSESARCHASAAGGEVGLVTHVSADMPHINPSRAAAAALRATRSAYQPSASDFSLFMTVRPKTKKRSYKPLTPAQQELFNVF